MAIVTKKKAKGGKGGICAGLSPRIRTGAWALVAVLCVGAAVWWLWAERARGKEQLRGAEPAHEDDGEECENVKVWKQPTANVEKGERGTGNGEWGTGNGEPQQEEEAQEVRRIVPGSKPGYWALPDGTEFRFKLPPEGETASLKVKGVLYRFDSEGNFQDISKPKVFDNPVENKLVGMAVEGGSFSPGLMLRHSDEEIMEALNKPVEILPDDSEEVRAKKEAVAELKRDILDFMAQGGTYEEYVTEAASMARQERAMKRDGIRKIAAMLDAGDAEGARDYYETFNRVLQESGYSALKLQLGLAERLGLNNGKE